MKKICLIIILLILVTGIVQAGTVFDAARDGNLDEVKDFIEKNPGLINQGDSEYWRTPLHWAALNGRRDVVEYLISKGARINQKDRYHQTPLFWALEKKHNDLAEYLKSHGAIVPEDIHVHVQGTEQRIVGIHFTGNPPTPPEVVYRTAYISAGILFLLAGLLQWFLGKKFLKNKNNQEDGKHDSKRIFKTVLIIIVVVLFYFISLEAVLQIFVHYNPYQKFIPDPLSHWRVNPRAAGRGDSSSGKDSPAPLEVFDNEYTPVKEEGVYRILCYGDSQTHGMPWVKDMSFTYPKQLQKRLREIFPQKKIEVINMGVAGYTTYQGLIYLKHIGLKYQPDCVILAYGYHDGNSAYAPDKDVSSNNLFLIKFRRLLYRSQIYLLIRKKILEKRVTFVENNGSQVFSRVSLDDYRKNLRKFVEIGKKNNFDVFYFIIPQQHKGNVRHTRYGEIMRKAAKDDGAFLIDGTKAMENIPLKQQDVFYYGR